MLPKSDSLTHGRMLPSQIGRSVAKADQSCCREVHGRTVTSRLWPGSWLGAIRVIPELIQHLIDLSFQVNDIQLSVGGAELSFDFARHHGAEQYSRVGRLRFLVDAFHLAASVHLFLELHSRQE